VCKATEAKTLCQDIHFSLDIKVSRIWERILGQGRGKPKFMGLFSLDQNKTQGFRVPLDMLFCCI